MKKKLLSLTLTIVFAIGAFFESEKPVKANPPVCKDGVIWSDKYGCEPPPCLGCLAWYEVVSLSVIEAIL